MTRYDLLKVNAGVLKIFAENKIDPKDVYRIEMFEEYCDLRNQGEKLAYVLASLADKYCVSEECVKATAKRMKKDVIIS